ncbi:NUDIX hydrolase [Pleurocapsales cyanobacterium LEGE 06147]|nr:NUDIX hydrolase [Pleurocapsales cyanobacterium LEGE 06147]
MTESPAVVAVAILYQEGNFLMQLRDDFPNIIYPGHWGLFGGHLEPGETPEAALKRELLEEINYAIAAPIKFRSYADSRVIRHVYHAPLKVSLDELVLNEGWDLGLVKLEDIQRGKCYSAKARQEKPLGDIHQHILLEFVRHC